MLLFESVYYLLMGSVPDQSKSCFAASSTIPSLIDGVVGLFFGFANQVQAHFILLDISAPYEQTYNRSHETVQALPKG